MKLTAEVSLHPRLLASNRGGFRHELDRLLG
jgi:hypothetical protein